MYNKLESLMTRDTITVTPSWLRRQSERDRHVSGVVPEAPKVEAIDNALISSNLIS
jgi:hypothetical protein